MSFDGWTEAESAGLLAFLFAHQIAPEFQCRLSWQVGDIAIWDNRSTQHFVVNNFEGERIIQRVTVTGDIVEPFGELNHDAWSNNNKFSAKSRNDLQLIGYLDSQKENH